MGYYVQRRKHNPAKWRVLWRKYIKDEKTGDYRPDTRHVKLDEYPQIGITKQMSFEEARDAVKKINLDTERSRREGLRNRVKSRIDSEDKAVCAHLPPAFVTKFETEHLSTRYIGNDELLKKMLKLWSTAKRLIRNVKQPTEKWHRYPEFFYVQFEKGLQGRGPMSLGYAKNILSVINMWLDFLGSEQEKMYRPVPWASQTWQARLNSAYEGADKGQASRLLTPEMLEGLKNPLKPAQHNWVYCTVWAGLRPNEADALTNPKRTRISYEGKTPILEVYQSKLKNVPKVAERWKRIPLFLPEQRKILKLIESGEIESPLAKTLTDRFGPGHTLYAGRKGFHDLMVTRFQQPELEVIRWLGHRSLDMALKHYAKKEAVRWNPVKKAA